MPIAGYGDVGQHYVPPAPQLSSGQYPGPRAVDDPRNSPAYGMSPGPATVAAYNSRDPQSTRPAPLATSDISQQPPGTGINPNLDYVAAFNASLARQRQSIDSQLAHSLGALGNRRDLAAAQIATMPGVIDKNFDQAAAATGVGAAVDRQAVSADATGGNANAQLLTGAFQADKAAGHAATPLLQLGAQANYDVGDAGLQQQAMLGRQNVDQRQADFALQQGQQAASWAHDAQLQSSQYARDDANRAQDRAWGIEDRNYAAANPTGTAQRDFVSEHQQNALFDAQLKAMQSGSSPDAGLTKTTGGQFTTQDALAQYTKSSQPYGWASRALAKGGGHAGTAGRGKTLDQAGVLSQITDGRVIAALVANSEISVSAGQAWIKAHPGM